jgi:hypothetical protein
MANDNLKKLQYEALYENENIEMNCFSEYVNMLLPMTSTISAGNYCFIVHEWPRKYDGSRFELFIPNSDNVPLNLCSLHASSLQGR